ETVERFCIKVVEGHARQDERENGRRCPRVPRTEGDGEGEQEKRKLHVAEGEAVHEQRRAECNCHGPNGKAIASNGQSASQQCYLRLHHGVSSVQTLSDR